MVSQLYPQYGRDYFGFIYVWYNRNYISSGSKKHPRLYVGSHYGAYDDGYICSSKWMKASYKKIPSNFIRRIVYWHSTPNQKSLLLKEQEWLNLIKDHEWGTRFYNLAKKANSVTNTLDVRQKISKTLTGRKLPPDHVESIRQAHLTRPPFTEEHRANISKSAKIRCQKNPPRPTEEQKKNQSAALIKYNQTKTKETKECPICNEEFEGDYRQKYCSRKCQRKNEYRMHAEIVKANAKKWLKNNKERAKQRSKSYYEQHKQLINTQPRYKECLICNCQFRYYTTRKLYCSKKCQKIACRNNHLSLNTG